MFPIFRSFRVRSFEKGLCYKSGEFSGVLAGGRRHWFVDPLYRVRVEVVSTREPLLRHKDLDLIIKSGALEGHAEVVDLKDHQRGLVWIDGRFAQVIGPGTHVLWTDLCQVRVEVIDLEEHAQAARALLAPEIIYLEDSEVIIHGISIWGSPWQPAFNDWAFNLPRGAPLARKWRQIPPHTDLLVTHSPPHGLGDGTTMPERTGCEDLREAVLRLRPTLHLFGHIHQDGGLWHEGEVCFANVSTWEGERGPTVMDLEPASKRVTPVTVPPEKLLPR